MPSDRRSMEAAGREPAKHSPRLHTSDVRTTYVAPDDFDRFGAPVWDGVQKFSAEWYRRFRAYHLHRFPDLDDASRDNLDMLVASAEQNPSLS